MELSSLSDVLIDELGALDSAEQQLIEALPKMASAANSYELREAFEAHLEETRTHVERLQQAFADMEIRFTPSKTCNAMHGLLQDSDDIIDATGDSVAIDAALIGVAQRIEQLSERLNAVARFAVGDTAALESIGAAALTDQRG